MNLLSQYFWIFLIFINSLNAFNFKKRSKINISQNPALEEGYDNITKGWLIFGNIPWLIMGIGILTGVTNNIWDYFSPKLMNPAVLFFHITIISFWIIGSFWIYVKDGAVFLARHPGLLNFKTPFSSKEITSAVTVKIIWALVMLGGIGGMILMWTNNLEKLS